MLAQFKAAYSRLSTVINNPPPLLPAETELELTEGVFTPCNGFSVCRWAVYEADTQFGPRLLLEESNEDGDVIYYDETSIVNVAAVKLVNILFESMLCVQCEILDLDNRYKETQEWAP